MSTAVSNVAAVDSGSDCGCGSKRGRGRPKVHSDIPSHLVCSVTGVKVKTTPVQFRKQLEKSGLDRETFMNTYVCRAAKTAMKQKKVEVIQIG